MRAPRFSLPLLLLLAPASGLAQEAVTLGSASAYGNFHTAGVVATVSGDTNRNASASLEWRRPGGTFRPGHPLIRVDETRFVGSVFDLAAGTAYELRIRLADPDGVVGAGATTVQVQTRRDALVEPSLRRLYVSPSGSDSNAGTRSNAPLRTLQRAAELARSGDLVLVSPGVYRESVVPVRSGTAAQPIVFRGTSAGVVLDGADGAIAAGVPWTEQGQGVHARVTGFPTAHVVTELGRLYRYASLEDLRALPAGPPGGIFFDGTTLFVKFADGSAPSAHAMHVARLEHGFLLDGRAHVRIENFDIRHYGAGEFGTGVYLRYSSDCAVRTCRIHELGSVGVRLRGGERNLVENNVFRDSSISGWPWSLVRQNSPTSAIYASHELGRGTVIRRNDVQGTFNGIYPCGSAPPPGAFTSETDVHDNTLSQHNDDALEPEGYCSNVRLWNNRLRDVHIAVSAAPAAPGPLWVLRNVAYRVGSVRSRQVDGESSTALKINSGSTTPSGPILLYHNTFFTDAPETYGVALLNPGAGAFISARNNVIAGTHYALYKANPIPWFGDGDDLFTTDPTRFVSWMGVRYENLAAFHAATGQEPHGISAAPMLVNPEAGDFAPAAGSPLIDRGVRLPGINDAFLGTAPDIGAIEFEPGKRKGRR